MTKYVSRVDGNGLRRSRMDEEFGQMFKTGIEEKRFFFLFFCNHWNIKLYPFILFEIGCLSEEQDVLTMLGTYKKNISKSLVSIWKSRVKVIAISIAAAAILLGLVGRLLLVDSSSKKSPNKNKGEANEEFGGVISHDDLAENMKSRIPTPSQPSTQSSPWPSYRPTVSTLGPTRIPSFSPSGAPSVTATPTRTPSEVPTAPTNMPSQRPTAPTPMPTQMPTTSPTNLPTQSPTTTPSAVPTQRPTTSPSAVPSDMPSTIPTISVRPTSNPTSIPSTSPTATPTITARPTSSSIPTRDPTLEPTSDPTREDSLTTFCIIADVPYDREEERELPKQIEDQIDDCEFMIHLGDIKRGDVQCTDDLFSDVKDILLESEIPVFIVPGDNEWNDCGNKDEIEDGIRHWKNNFLRLEDNWDHDFDVNVQSGYRENFYMIHKHTLFFGLNIVGGDVHDADEWSDRLGDEADWVKEVVEEHVPSDASGVIIMAHANPTANHRKFFNPMKEFIGDELDNEIPFLYLHGDGHSFIYTEDFHDQSNYARIQHEGGTRDPILKILADPKKEGPRVRKAFQYDRQK